jgi:hypothetical protein
VFSQVNAISVVGSIPGSSTEKMLVRAVRSGQFSFPINIPSMLGRDVRLDRRRDPHGERAANEVMATEAVSMA